MTRESHGAARVHVGDDPVPGTLIGRTLGGLLLWALAWRLEFRKIAPAASGNMPRPRARLIDDSRPAQAAFGFTLEAAGFEVLIAAMTARCWTSSPGATV